MDFSQGVPYSKVKDLTTRFPVAQHIHCQITEVPLEKSFFDGRPHPEKFCRLVLELGQEQMNKDKYVSPHFYFWHTNSSGDEVVRIVDLQNLINYDMKLAQDFMATEVEENKTEAYAFMMRAHVAKIALFKMRTNIDIDLSSNPSYQEALVAYCEYKDGSRAYMTQNYGQSDAILFWDGKPKYHEVPPHYIPGRVFRLFDHVAEEAEEEEKEEGEEA
ncbi:hypothetical protein LCGC14_0836250 [marine sediment metagenome]|uniref:Uncharacterized protein n=1 Tax=marine sediment metagenome TaxID=412755 RepID=A0A0F9PJ36_9ZZZZ